MAAGHYQDLIKPLNAISETASDSYHHPDVLSSKLASHSELQG
jgi:pterin-4a-carbinolamine dehydratase